MELLIREIVTARAGKDAADEVVDALSGLVVLPPDDARLIGRWLRELLHAKRGHGGMFRACRLYPCRAFPVGLKTRLGS